MKLLDNIIPSSVIFNNWDMQALEQDWEIQRIYIGRSVPVIINNPKWDIIEICHQEKKKYVRKVTLEVGLQYLKHVFLNYDIPPVYRYQLYNIKTKNIVPGELI